mgnify:CR=1 FL=1
MAQQSFVKIVTPIRTIKSEIGQVKITLFNDQISLTFQPASGQRTDYGTIKYNGSPQVAANVRFSIGVAAAISKLIRDVIVPATGNNQPGHWDVFACKRKTYESYLGFDVQNGMITMTGTESNNGMRKQASYVFPTTIITDGQNNSVNIQGEALALAELLAEIGAGNEMPLHMRQYNQAVKDNLSDGSFNPKTQVNSQGFSTQPPQPMSTWRPN